MWLNLKKLFMCFIASRRKRNPRRSATKILWKLAIGLWQEKGVNDIDTKTRHVTQSGANLFAELGFDLAEAEQLQAQSRKRINDTNVLKEALMSELAKWIKENHLKQEEAAVILHVTRPRVSDVVNKKISKFTIDALVGMLTRIGKTVHLAIG
jgi:predicted XRE-type DNA-binding protein